MAKTPLVRWVEVGYLEIVGASGLLGWIETCQLEIADARESHPKLDDKMSGARSSFEQNERTMRDGMNGY